MKNNNTKIINITVLLHLVITTSFITSMFIMQLLHKKYNHTLLEALGLVITVLSVILAIITVIQAQQNRKASQVMHTNTIATQTEQQETTLTDDKINNLNSENTDTTQSDDQSTNDRNNNNTHTATPQEGKLEKYTENEKKADAVHTEIQPATTHLDTRNKLTHAANYLDLTCTTACFAIQLVSLIASIRPEWFANKLALHQVQTTINLITSGAFAISSALLLAHKARKPNNKQMKKGEIIASVSMLAATITAFTGNAINSFCKINSNFNPALLIRIISLTIFATAFAYTIFHEPHKELVETKSTQTIKQEGLTP